MKKVLLGILIAGIVLIGGCSLAAGVFVSSVDSAIEEVEQETASKDEVYADLVKDIEWAIENDGFIPKVVGVLENTTDEKIDYIQFEYKFMDADGVVIEKSFTNEVDIAPGEKRKVEIFANENMKSFTIEAKSSVF